MAEHSVTLELFYNSVWNTAPVRDATATYRRGTTSIGNDTDPASGSATIDNVSEAYAPRSVASSLYGKIGQNTPCRLSADGSVRMYGEVVSWKPQRPIKGTSYTPIQMAGILQRIGRGTDPIQSPMRRSFANDAVQAIAYWPLEEVKGSTVAYDTVNNLPSAVGGFTGLVSGNAGAPQFGIVDAGLGSLPIANLAGGWNLDLNLPVVAATGQVTLQFTAAFGTVVRNVGVQTMGIRLDPTFAAKHLQWSVGIFDDGKVNLRWLEADNALNLLAGPTEVYAAGSGTRNIFDGQPRVFQLNLAASGGTNVAWQLYENDVSLASGTITPSFSGAMNARPWRASANSTNAADVLSGWGHVGVWTTNFTPTRTVPLFAHVGETAADRFSRLCTEEGVTGTVVGTAAESMPMGPQSTSPFLDQLDEIANTDDASIFESRSALGLTMRTGGSKLNQSPALTVSYLGQIKPGLVPVFGDEGIRNDVTARNPDGATRRVIQTTGPRNVQAPGTNSQAVGRYKTSVDVNTSTANALTDEAGWRVNLGTYDGTWYATVTADLDAAPSLISAVNAVDIGDVVAISNLPVDEALDTVDGVVIGIEESLPSKRRLVTFYLVPAAPYRVGKLANTTGDTDPVVGRLDTDGSTVSSAITAAQIMCDTFESGISAWSPQSGWTIVSDTAHVRSGTKAMKMTPPGGTASGGAVARQTNPRLPATAGVTYLCEVWFFSVAGWSDCRAAVDWYDASGVFISSSLGSATSVPAGVYTVSRQTFTAPANTASAQPRARQGGTPAITDVLWVDDVVFMPRLQIATTSGPLWTTDADDVPLDLIIGGQRVSISNISGASSPQQFVLDPTGRIPAYDIPSGAVVNVYQPVILAM